MASKATALMLLGFLGCWNTCTASNLQCSFAGMAPKWCNPKLTFGSSINAEERPFLKALSLKIIDGVLHKNEQQFIEYEIGIERTTDAHGLPPDIRDWLFADGSSKYFNGISVRQLLLESEKPAIDVEGATQWGGTRENFTC